MESPKKLSKHIIHPCSLTPSLVNRNVLFRHRADARISSFAIKHVGEDVQSRAYGYDGKEIAELPRPGRNSEGRFNRSKQIDRLRRVEHKQCTVAAVYDIDIDTDP